MHHREGTSFSSLLLVHRKRDDGASSQSLLPCRRTEWRAAWSGARLPLWVGARPIGDRPPWSKEESPPCPLGLRTQATGGWSLLGRGNSGCTARFRRACPQRKLRGKIVVSRGQLMWNPVHRKRSRDESGSQRPMPAIPGLAVLWRRWLEATPRTVGQDRCWRSVSVGRRRLAVTRKCIYAQFTIHSLVAAGRAAGRLTRVLAEIPSSVRPRIFFSSSLRGACIQVARCCRTSQKCASSCMVRAEWFTLVGNVCWAMSCCGSGRNNFGGFIWHFCLVDTCTSPLNGDISATVENPAINWLKRWTTTGARGSNWMCVGVEHSIAGLPWLLQMSLVFIRILLARVAAQAHISLDDRVSVCTSTGNRSVWLLILASQHTPEFCR